MKTPGKIIFCLVVLSGLLASLYLVAHGLFQKRVSLPQELSSLLENADDFTLFSIAPDEEDPSTNSFRGHVILGKLEVKSLVTRTNLVAALNEGIAAENWSYLPVSVRAVPTCFNPRHAIRAKKGDKMVELLICFECEQIEITSNKNEKWSYLTTSDPAAIFNGILKNANIPLPTN